MKISIIGCGYVGIVTGACLANSGHKIFFFYINQKKLNNFKIRNNIIFEKNLKKKLISAKKNIFFCKNLDDAINKSDVTFVCVGTPLKRNNIDLKYIKSVTTQISEKIKQRKKYSIIYKSTIPPLTIEKICIPILRKKLGNKIEFFENRLSKINSTNQEKLHSPSNYQKNKVIKIINLVELISTQPIILHNLNKKGKIDFRKEYKSQRTFHYNLRFIYRRIFI
jgi:UDP-glucose 6-dehydrogenase